MIFANRTDAGKQLAERLSETLSANSIETSELIAVGLPRGGVPVALEVAKRFGCPLDIIVSKKLSFPGQPEYAIGAVSSRGVLVLSPEIPDEEQWRSYVQEQSRALIQATRAFEDQYYRSSNCSACSFENKVVLIIDDGIATGMTAIAAVETARQRGARKTIIAAPVMSRDSYAELSNFCDFIVCVHLPDQFRAVGTFYSDFKQCTNEEVESALRTAKRFRILQGNQDQKSNGEPMSSKSKSA